MQKDSWYEPIVLHLIRRVIAPLGAVPGLLLRPKSCRAASVTGPWEYSVRVCGTGISAPLVPCKGAEGEVGDLQAVCLT